MESKLLTTKEVAQVLRCSLQYMYRLIKDPTFPKVKIGKHYLVPEDELDKWIYDQIKNRKEEK